MILREKVITTVAKAKEMRPLVEKFITMAKEDSLHKRRQALSYIFEKDAVQKLFSELGPRFKTRNGGYTRIVRTDFRAGDSAPMAVIEFVDKAEIKTSNNSETDATKSVSEKKSAKKAAPKSEGKKEASAKPKKTAVKKKTEKSE